METVTFLGTGLLGAGFVEGMVARGGSTVRVWNRTRSKAEPLAALGATVCDTPAEAVRGAARVHLVLLDDATVDSTIEALRPGLADGAIIIDHTTNLPALVAARAARLEAEGVAYVSAPVFMNPDAARGATGLMMVACSQARFDALQPHLVVMTGDLWYVGDRTDLAASYKLMGNALLLAMVGALADVFHLADAMHVDRENAWLLFSRFKTENILPIRARKILSEDFTPSFELQTARKDARLMLDSAGEEPVPMLSAVAARMDALIAQGFGADDLAVLARKGA